MGENAFDRFLAKSFENIVKEKLGLRTFRRIERQLLNDYELTVHESISDFTKIDMVLKDILGPGAEKIEKGITKSIFKHNTKNSIKINDQSLCELIFHSYGDATKKTILDLLYKQSLLLFDIPRNTDIPQATVYRRAKELIEDGLITGNGFETTGDGKIVKKYTTLLSGFSIALLNNKYQVEVGIKPRFIENSALYSK